MKTQSKLEKLEEKVKRTKLAEQLAYQKLVDAILAYTKSEGTK